jgi:Reverse transcriptase (RNA-dependent DNA polymerase)
VDYALAGLTDNTCVSFFNDILVYGNTREQVVKRTREVLQHLRKAGLFIRLHKCQFHVQEVSFLGFIISNGKVKMEPERVSAIQEWPEPTKPREIQEFLGFANFYRRFVRNYSQIAKGLTDLLKKRPGAFQMTK